MEHLALLYYVLSFITGWVSAGIALLIYTQYRKEVIRFYALFPGWLLAMGGAGYTDSVTQSFISSGALVLDSRDFSAPSGIIQLRFLAL